jgi:serine/threonine-protein kinase
MDKGDSHVGTVLDGRYRVERLLGEGGMGSVYEGRHVLVGKRVAIKMLHAEYATNEEILKRFYREAQSAAAIGHKNIIDIYDVGVTAKNEPYIAMEYLEGEDLEGMLEREGALTVEAACGVLEPALLALAAAHSKGIVHRDLKPANIFLVRGEGGAPVVKLIDFGISKVTGGGSNKLTQTGTLLGTPAYMSPEQARGDQDVDHRTDVYAMGVILYQMLTGQLPFTGDNYNTLLIKVLTESARPPREINPSIPAEAETLVLRELSKDAGARSQSAMELLGGLQQLTAFERRNDGMSMLGTRLQSVVARGDLGGAKGGGGQQSSASDVLSQMVNATPGRWAGTDPGRRRVPVAGLAIGGVVLLAVVVVVAFLISGKGGDQPPVVPLALPATAVPAAVPDVPPPAPEPRGVTIEVVGAPEGARILYDGAPVPVNPFPVDRKGTLVKLEVQAEGFAPFTTAIIPSEDRKIEVSLEAGARQPEKTAKSGPSHKSGSSGKAKAQEPAAGGEPAGEGSKVKDGKRGTKFGGEFE